MKYFIIILIAILSGASAMAESKVIERSAKKAPDWITGGAEGYLVAAVEAPSIAEARTRAEQDIAAQISMAVARNVVASFKNESYEVTSGCNVDSRDEFTSSLAVKGANLPFMKGISLSNAQDIYWVKLQDKKTKREYYQYYVKYPLYRQQLAAMVQEFEDYDNSKVTQLENLSQEIHTVTSMEEINSALTQLAGLEEYFVDSARCKEVTSLATQYRQLPKSLTLRGDFTEPGILIVTLDLNGRDFRGSGVCKATSNCAGIIRSQLSSEGCYTITFDTEYCLPDEENAIDCTLSIGGQRLKGHFIIPSSLIPNE